MELRVKSMITEIGLAAGDLWRLLDEKGPLELSKAIEQTPHSEELMLMAIGWLCREGHVLITNRDGKLFVELRSGKRNTNAGQGLSRSI